MSDNVIQEAHNPPQHWEETLVSNASGPFGIDALPSSTPEYAPVVQMFVEQVMAEPAAESTIKPVAEPIIREPIIEAKSEASSPLEKQAYDLMVQVVSRDPRFELNHNVRQVLEEVQLLRAKTASASADTNNTDLAIISETVQNIWTHLQKEGTENREHGGAETENQTPNASPTQELINETRALVRSVNEEVNASRNNTIQLTNQVRTAMDVATRCLREMDKTAVKYEQKYNQNSEAGPLLDELRSLRDMLADGFENARLEPIEPEPGETFRYNEHRPENGFAASGKIKRTLYPGFRWMQPTPPVVLLPALVETE